MKLTVEFLRENAPYQIGEKAAFPEARARALIAAGAARECVVSEAMAEKRNAVVTRPVRKG